MGNYGRLLAQRRERRPAAHRRPSEADREGDRERHADKLERRHATGQRRQQGQRRPHQHGGPADQRGPPGLSPREFGDGLSAYHLLTIEISVSGIGHVKQQAKLEN